VGEVRVGSHDLRITPTNKKDLNENSRTERGQGNSRTNEGGGGDLIAQMPLLSLEQREDVGKRERVEIARLGRNGTRETNNMW